MTQLWQPSREIIHDLENNFKQNNILKLKQIFPEVFCKDQIDFEKLKLVLGAENLAGVGERYQLDAVETSSVVYSISRRILKHEHAQKHPSYPVSGFGYPQRHHAPSRVAAAANLLGRGHHHRNAHHPRHARTRRKNLPLQRLERRV